MPDIDSSQFPHLYRAIVKRSWYDADSRRILSAAFILRSDETGLSVLKSVECSPQDCHAVLNKCFGEFVLETEGVVALGLRVVDDDLESTGFSINHAEITGVPTSRTTPEEVKIAEDFASELAELSTLHYDRKGIFHSRT